MSAATDAAGLLDAVRADPADDLPRLAYADWLDENAQADRAEFVRVQCELARLPDVREAPAPRHPPPGAFPAPLASVPLSRRQAEAVGRLIKRREELQAREDQLMGQNVSTRPNSVRPRWCRWCEEGGLDPAWVVVPGFGVGRDERGKNAFRRGFVEKIRCPLAAWLERGPAIVRAHPVTRVELTDRRPGSHYRPPLGDWYWVCRHGDTGHLADRLPPALYATLPEGAGEDPDGVMTYATESLARDASSAALVAWANLPDAERASS